MDRMKKNFGFGMMRLPQRDGQVDTAETCAMVDLFLERGFNYFDIARGYCGGKCEEIFRECVAKRYPRERYVVANKLSTDFFQAEEEIRPLFDAQLAACGVDYFDYYLMHAQDARKYEKYRRLHAYEIAASLKAAGKIRRLGLSFHGTPELLAQILTENPQIEFVQLQFNYIDVDDPMIRSLEAYELCRARNLPVLVMEPCKGGILIDLPHEISAVLHCLGGGGSNAEYAIRYAADWEGIAMVLSGMSNLEQLEQNTAFMQDYRHLTQEEHRAITRARGRLLRQRGRESLACTHCRYCIAGCPKSIPIPEVIACLDSAGLYKTWTTRAYYNNATLGRGRASDCIGCGKCERICPQHIGIRSLLKKAVEQLESK